MNPNDNLINSLTKIVNESSNEFHSIPFVSINYLQKQKVDLTQLLKHYCENADNLKTMTLIKLYMACNNQPDFIKNPCFEKVQKKFQELATS